MARLTDFHRQQSPRDKAHRLMEVERSGTAAESAVLKHIHLAVVEPTVDL
jgi:hypothetical protein